MNNILFVTNDTAPWIDSDQAILSGKFNVRRRHLSISYYLNLYVFFKDIIGTDLVYLWFGTFSALPLLCLAKIFRKKIIIVSGGFDVARLDEFNHGAFAKGKKGKVLRKLIFKMADLVFCVSESNRKEANANANIPAQKLKLIPLGFESLVPLNQIRPWSDRKNQVVSISSVSRKYFRIKGLDQIIKVANTLPDVSFIHIGQIDPGLFSEIQKIIPKNLILKGFLPFKSDDFLAVLSESKIVLQLSAYESFCSAVVEGGLCGCFPITSDRFALPELTKIYGYSVPFGDVPATAGCILKTIQSNQDSGQIAEAFLNRFCLENRQSRILGIVHSLIQ